MPEWVWSGCLLLTTRLPAVTKRALYFILWRLTFFAAKWTKDIITLPSSNFHNSDILSKSENASNYQTARHQISQSSALFNCQFLLTEMKIATWQHRFSSRNVTFWIYDMVGLTFLVWYFCYKMESRNEAITDSLIWWFILEKINNHCVLVKNDIKLALSFYEVKFHNMIMSQAE